MSLLCRSPSFTNCAILCNSYPNVSHADCNVFDANTSAGCRLGRLRKQAVSDPSGVDVQSVMADQNLFSKFTLNYLLRKCQEIDMMEVNILTDLARIVTRWVFFKI